MGKTHEQPPKPQGRGWGPGPASQWALLYHDPLAMRRHVVAIERGIMLGSEMLHG
jgi:hypothetical protein